MDEDLHIYCYLENSHKLRRAMLLKAVWKNISKLFVPKIFHITKAWRV